MTKKSERKKRLAVPDGTIEALMDMYGAGRTTVYTALNFGSDSRRAAMIRQTAIEKYGAKVEWKVKFN